MLSGKWDVQVVRQDKTYCVGGFRTGMVPSYFRYCLRKTHFATGVIGSFLSDEGRGRPATGGGEGGVCGCTTVRRSRDTVTDVSHRLSREVDVQERG